MTAETKLFDANPANEHELKLDKIREISDKKRLFFEMFCTVFLANLFQHWLHFQWFMALTKAAQP